MIESTLPTTSPQVNAPKVRHRFAVREKKHKFVTLICECSRTVSGKGISRWKLCPYCGATIITSKEQRRVIQQRHQLSEVVEEPAAEVKR